MDALIIPPLFLLVVVVPYFLPTIIAMVRKKRNAGAVAALNFFLGWTVVGWIVALIWALTVDAPAVAVTNVTNYPVAPPPAAGSIQGTGMSLHANFCQGCGAKLQSDARFCPSCGRLVG
jgi:Superinfection immunity protein/zinc-ribbon domain